MMRDVLDLQRFPLDRSDGETYNTLVERCRQDLVREGMFNLDGFLRPDVAADIARFLAPRFDEQAFEHSREHNIYFTDAIDDLPADHPAQEKVVTSNHTLCADQAADTVLEQVYAWEPLQRFLADVMELPRLYVMDDPLSCWNVMRYREGQGLNWHFDRSEFTTTLLLQAPDTGGEFEYRSNLRSDSDQNYEGVGDLLTGRDPKVRKISLAAGTLNVFRGKNTAHRVTPVQGGTDRIIAVFTYFQTPGMRFTDAENMGFYGRAAST